MAWSWPHEQAPGWKGCDGATCSIPPGAVARCVCARPFSRDAPGRRFRDRLAPVEAVNSFRKTGVSYRPGSSPQARPARTVLHRALTNRWVKVAMKLISMSSPRKASRQQGTCPSSRCSQVHARPSASSRVNQNVEPLPTSLSTPTCPSWPSMMALQMCRPSPIPVVPDPPCGRTPATR